MIPLASYPGCLKVNLAIAARLFELILRTHQKFFNLLFPHICRKQYHSCPCFSPLSWWSRRGLDSGCIYDYHGLLSTACEHRASKTVSYYPKRIEPNQLCPFAGPFQRLHTEICCTSTCTVLTIILYINDTEFSCIKKITKKANLSKGMNQLILSVWLIGTRWKYQ